MAQTSEEIRQLDVSRRMSHGVQLARAARQHGDKLAFRYLDQSRSFRELDERATRVARALQRRGVGEGDRVAVLMPNCLEIVETFFGVSRLGAIAVPVNFRLVAAEVAWILSHCGAKALVIDASLGATAAEVLERSPQLEAVLLVGEPEGVGLSRAESYESALAAEGTEPLWIDVPDDAPAFIMYTSGTTGRPKGAVLSHKNLFMNSFNGMIEQRISGADEVWLTGLPLFHIGALNGILPYVMTGGLSILWPTGHFDAREALDELERSQVTGCFFVATQWQEVCALPDLRDRKLALRRLAWGASPAFLSTLQQMNDCFPGVPIYNCFGQTEMSSLTCILKGEDAVRKIGSVGKPCVNVDVRIVDDDMNDCAPGEVGEIVYRGPTVMQGYWNDPEATAEAYRGGWFHSGDLVRRDDEGYITVIDRKKDMIISGGENIYSAEVEAALSAHSEVAEVAVIGVPHPRWVETPRAVVVARNPDSPPTPEELIEHCKKHLASYKKPTSVVFVDALPRNPSGKVLKIRLRETHGAPDAGAPKDAG